MSANPVLDQLNSQVAAFPTRASGEELYDYVGRFAARFSSSDRDALAAAMTDWLILRNEPKTMLAVQITSDLQLVEVRPELEALLMEIREGRVFLPFYAKPIEAALLSLQITRGHGVT
ncbi:MAG: hypothetical protein ING61_00240 [Rhodocyclaceae bacterium]|nr:hypothetical protein [Rhodocyclaceae bacterium]MCA3023433.1 hypothetical protein [Rhodocyclaceae bacterium]MCA3024638.1 hypothetical protein [Rhodocyclaceae bacterium]MCA3043561.1 hypothetical protein [Rhodocyclaceae bacterium]MCA3047366.1 hypothetical protein [Rhodocyclaceae bacterium]